MVDGGAGNDRVFGAKSHAGSYFFETGADRFFGSAASIDHVWVYTDKDVDAFDGGGRIRSTDKADADLLD